MTGWGLRRAVDDKTERDDLAAWAFREHYGSIFRYLRRKTGSAEQAEELTQQVFADAVAALRTFRPGETPVLAALYALARRRLADAVRRSRRGRPPPVPVDELADVLVEPERDQELTQALRRALARLPPELGMVVVLKLVEGRRFADIAARLGVSEAACRKRFQRGLEPKTILQEQRHPDVYRRLCAHDRPLVSVLPTVKERGVHDSE